MSDKKELRRDRFGPMKSVAKSGAPADHFEAAPYRPSRRTLARMLRRVRAERERRA